jgi:ABC-type phosphate transport system substrate-binding protein
MKIKLILLLLFTMLLVGVTFAQSFQVVVNVDNITESLSQKELADLFLKKKKKWDDGEVVRPVDLNSTSEVRSLFSKTILKKNIAAVRSFWQQAAFSGTAIAPPEKKSDLEVIDYVKKYKGAVGYVSYTFDCTDVKVLKVE